MNKKLKITVLALASSAILSTAVQANNFRSANDAIHYRQSAFSMLAYNFGDMGAMLKGKRPFDSETFAMRAENVAALAKIAQEGFIPGSDQGETEALAKIWTEKSDFDAKMIALQDNAAALLLASASDDKKLLKQSFMNVAKTCKGCHDVYKKD